LAALLFWTFLETTFGICREIRPENVITSARGEKRALERVYAPAIVSRERLQSLTSWSHLAHISSGIDLIAPAQRGGNSVFYRQVYVA
jgi:hypothetical protein